MDEFFDFENAILSTGHLDKPLIAPNDIDTALAGRAQPDDPLTHISQFADPMPQHQPILRLLMLLKTSPS
jgi:hypothetical protein